MHLNFLEISSKKNIQILNFIKIRPVGVQLFHSDVQTDITKLIVAFSLFFERVLKAQEMNIHALSWIRTRDPRNQAAADLLLKTPSHHDQFYYSNNVAYT